MTGPTEHLRLHLLESLRQAHVARRGIPTALESEVREYARALREGGVPIERSLIDVKELVMTAAGSDAPAFTPRLVGWMVSGYFARDAS